MKEMKRGLTLGFVLVVLLFLSNFIYRSVVSAQSAIGPVSIVGDRFYSGGAPYYPTANFLSLPISLTFTHVYFSDQVNNAQRQAMVSSSKSEGHNSIFLYTLNQGDYGSRSVTPYASGIIGGAFDEAKIASWKSEMESMISTHKLRPIIWLFADDSFAIRDASTTELKRYISKMVASFDDLPVMWVLALEANEYFSKSKTDDLGSHLASLASNPVGVHQTGGRTDYMVSSWVEFGVYQYGFNKTWQTIYSDTVTKKATIGGKPFFAGEYSRASESTNNVRSKQQGLAAAFAGAAGSGNGAPGGLDEFMAQLPDNMSPSRNGDILTLVGGVPLVTATANMNTLEMTLNGSTPIPTSTPSPTPIPTPTPSPAPLTPGDANEDGVIDGVDYVIWLNNYNTTTSNLHTDGDFNGDGVVDGVDYVVWLNNYGL